MKSLKELFKIDVTPDRLQASLSFRNPDLIKDSEEEIKLTKESRIRTCRK